MDKVKISRIVHISVAIIVMNLDKNKGLEKRGVPCHLPVLEVAKLGRSLDK